ncbi:hypothetical protein AVEN_239084-1 [Araneus ventricosus]|uniref:Uncharacterized protein n=1 Tax=Araneus ventricosus TaxID=182803 RepID=A0A4Y2FN68_ARAVE|nr:hypothetical protein AVEN_239084-1 [Araneus ventricosus]
MNKELSVNEKFDNSAKVENPLIYGTPRGCGLLPEVCDEQSERYMRPNHGEQRFWGVKNNFKNQFKAHPEMKKLSKDDINSGIAGFTGFVIFGLLMATTRLSSLLFVEAITRYNVDRERAAFPFILLFMTRNTIGPLVGFSVKLFGLRAVTISGCIFSAIGIAGCFFAEDIITVTIMWGVVYGKMKFLNFLSYCAAVLFTY